MFNKSQVDYSDIMMFSLAVIVSIPEIGLVSAALVSIPPVEGLLAIVL